MGMIIIMFQSTYQWKFYWRTEQKVPAVWQKALTDESVKQSTKIDINTLVPSRRRQWHHVLQDLVFSSAVTDIDVDI